MVKSERSHREVLAESYIAAVAIAVLLLWSLDAVLRGLLIPLYRVAEFLVTAVAIFGIPNSSGRFGFHDRFELFVIGSYFYSALLSFACAWILSRWAYGAKPFRALIQCRARFARRNHV